MKNIEYKISKDIQSNFNEKLNRNYMGIDTLELVQHGFFKIILKELKGNIDETKDSVSFKSKHNYEKFVEEVKKSKTLLFHANQYIKVDGQNYSKHVARLKKYFNEDILVLEEFDTSQGLNYSPYLTNFNTKEIEITDQIEYLVEKLSNKYKIPRKKFYSHYEYKVKEHILKRLNFYSLLKDSNVEQIFILGGYWNKSIIEVAKILNIKTIEIQYAHFDENHLAFNYHGYKPLYYPDAMLLWDTVYKLDSLYNGQVKEFFFDRDYLITNFFGKISSMEYVTFVSQWLNYEHMAKLFNDLEIRNSFIFEHPNQKENIDLKLKNVVENKFLNEYIINSKIVIGYNSTVLIKSLFLGKIIITTSDDSILKKLKTTDEFRDKIFFGTTVKEIEGILEKIKNSKEDKELIIKGKYSLKEMNLSQINNNYEVNKLDSDLFIQLPLAVCNNAYKLSSSINELINSNELEYHNDTREIYLNTKELYIQNKNKVNKKLLSLELKEEYIYEDLFYEKIKVYDYKIAISKEIEDKNVQIQNMEKWLQEKDYWLKKKDKWLEEKDYWLEEKDNKINNLEKKIINKIINKITRK